MIDLNGSNFYDKVYGCWLGKNCGGTLGAPLEKGLGEPEPFDVWWYPSIKEGGIPNDDLEMQLVWLRAFQEHGVNLEARHLAQYWLNHIGYNWDEYGWARMNLRLGLLPPVSGNYNNWFLDCMGCPIRSEIFACVAPGLPRLAVRYAYEDAIVDHAGGESVYGEMFNTAVESAAFLVADLNDLLDIGRSYVPDGTKTALAIDAARQAHAGGLDWKAARKKVLDATPHYNSQYSPINMGFQAIGLLYGGDFAEAICIAVNCGYDTDCTGATVGSILGILLGKNKLPTKWTEPLGDVIATNESWGGIRNFSSAPLPTTLRELTLQTIAMAKVISANHAPSLDALHADDSVRALWKLPPTRVPFSLGTFRAGVDYLDTPAVVSGSTKTIHTVLTNTAPIALEVRCSLRVPAGWQAPLPQSVIVPAKSESTLKWGVAIPPARLLENTNTLDFHIDSPQRTAELAAPVVLIGARRMRASRPYTIADATRAELLEHPFEPEHANDGLLDEHSRNGDWFVHSALGHDLALDSLLPANHVIYVQAFFYSPVERPVVLGLPTTGSIKSWVNGQSLHNALEAEPFRPHGHKTQGYLDVTLRPGYNEVLAKFLRPADAIKFEAHLILVDPADLNAGIVDLPWTRFPWEE